MAVALDDLHYSFREIDGYNKAFNFILSARELGKTTAAWMRKIYPGWKKNKKPWIYTTRHSVEITEALLTSIQDAQLNKFSDDNVRFRYTKGSFKDGIVDVYIGKDLFIRIVSLSIALQRIKKAVLVNLAGVLTDEYVIDPTLNEHYLKGEAKIMREAYTTWRREASGVLKWYILGNPYSLFNPLFLEWNVDVSKLTPGGIYIGDYFLIHTPVLTKELMDKLLEENPLYKFNENYKLYALLGQATNDRNIKLGKLPQGFSLKFTFRMQDRYIGVFQTDDYRGFDRFYCRFLDEVGAKRTIYCFDFESLVEKCQLLALDDRFKLSRFKDALRNRQVLFQDINVYYFVKEIYNVI